MELWYSDTCTRMHVGSRSKVTTGAGLCDGDSTQRLNLRNVTMSDTYHQEGFVQPTGGQRSNGMATAALVLGLVSVVLMCIWYVAIPCGILAIVFGYDRPQGRPGWRSGTRDGYRGPDSGSMRVGDTNPFACRLPRDIRARWGIYDGGTAEGGGADAESAGRWHAVTSRSVTRQRRVAPCDRGRSSPSGASHSSRRRTLAAAIPLLLCWRAVPRGCAGL